MTTPPEGVQKMDTTERAEPMKGLAEWLRRLANAEVPRLDPNEFRELLERWASEVEAACQRPAEEAVALSVKQWTTGEENESRIDIWDGEKVVARVVRGFHVPKAEVEANLARILATNHTAQAASAEPITDGNADQRLTDMLMECADRLGENPRANVDPRAWEHLLVYAPKPHPVARVAEVHMGRYTVEWTSGPLPEGTALYAHLPQPDPQLCKFYDVTTFPELVAAMEEHILKLQTKLPKPPSFAPQRVREG
jgi:hypothetical protein